MNTLENLAIGARASSPRHLLALCVAISLIALAAAAPADAYTKTPAYTEHRCTSNGQCTDIYHREFPNAGACTRFFQRWKREFSYENDEAMVACREFMGIDKFCADRDSTVVVGFMPAPGTWEGQTRLLKCTPSFHPDTIGDHFIHIWTGIGHGLLTAAPFVGEAVLAGTCLYGQVYACAVLALEISEQAGVKIPTEVGEAVYIAGKAPACIDGDAVACAYLGERGAKAVGLEIPGVPAAQILDDSRKCNDGDFMACARLGKAAADAGGIETGSALEGVLDGQACLDGNKDTCFKLAKEAIKDHVPIDRIAGARESATACEAGDAEACVRLGELTSSAVSGLAVDVSVSAPFGANACVSAPGTRGAVDLASAWEDRGATSIAVFPSDGARFTAPFPASNRNGGWAAKAKWAAADFTGDGATDMLAAWNDRGNNTLTLRQATDSGFTVSHWAVQAGTWVDTTVWLPGDFNGDGRMDIAAAWEDQQQTSVAVYLSDGSRFQAPRQWSQRDGGWSDGVKWAVGDFTGDGKADIASVWNNGGTNSIALRQSTGAGFTPVQWASNAGGWLDSSVWLAGDYNGDGRLDLADAWHDGNDVSIAVYASNGSRFPGWNQWSQHEGGWIDSAKWTTGDFNGDGKTDLAAIWNNGGTNTMSVRQSTGAAFTTAHWATNAGGWSPSAAWCAGQFPDGVAGSVAESDDRIATTRAVIQPAPVKPQARVKLDGAPASAAPSTPMSTCGNAAVAAARNSPAAPGLKQLCLSRGGFLVLEPPLDAASLQTLAVQGGPIVDADPELSALRAQQSGDAGMRGFNIGVAAAGHDTAPGPGKQHIYNSLARDERPGYDAAVAFVLERNRR